jgi:ribose transport system permease protein
MNKVIKKTTGWLNANPIVVASLFLMIIMALFVPKFANIGNIMTVLGQMSYLGIATVGLAFVLIGGGNDLSIGSTITISGVLGAMVMVNMSGAFTVGAGVAITLATGLAIGLINGIMVAYLKINAFMMTLITQMLFEGIALLITDAKTITGIPANFVAIANTQLLGIPVSIYLMLAVFVIGQFILTSTAYGRKLFATGANAKAAKLVGINTEVMLLSAYLICGLLGGVSGIIMTCRLGVGSPSSGSNIIMEIMSAAIIGGNSLFGGKGTVVGAAFGSLLLCLISNGLTLLGIEYTVTMIVKGLIILFAVVIDMMNLRLSAKKLLAA